MMVKNVTKPAVEFKDFASLMANFNETVEDYFKYKAVTDLSGLHKKQALRATEILIQQRCLEHLRDNPAYKDKQITFGQYVLFAVMDYTAKTYSDAMFSTNPTNSRLFELQVEKLGYNFLSKDEIEISDKLSSEQLELLHDRYLTASSIIDEVFVKDKGLNLPNDFNAEYFNRVSQFILERYQLAKSKINKMKNQEASARLNDACTLFTKSTKIEADKPTPSEGLEALELEPAQAASSSSM